MNVLYTCDNNYIWLMAISTISLFETNKNMKDLSVYLLGENISDENKKILDDIAKKYNRNIVVIDVEKIEIPTKLASTRWPISAFTRLFAGEYLPNDMKKILYLDCDTIINGDISKLDTIEFNDYYLMGVRDCINSRYNRNIGLDPDDTYINAGVILMNLDELRKINVREKINSFIDNYGNCISFADQDILNGIYKSKIGTIDPNYDVMTIFAEYEYKDIIKLRNPSKFYGKEKIDDAKNNPLIIHYTTNMKTIRPWYSNSDHKLKENFLKYLSMSPYKDRSLNEFTFNTKESKVIGLIQKFPNFISYRVLGLIHSNLKPNYVYYKNKKKEKTV